jgi:hypothetical protein
MSDQAVTAHPFRDGGDWWVCVYLNGREFEVAGPFDDEHEAGEMAIRTTEAA